MAGHESKCVVPKILMLVPLVGMRSEKSQFYFDSIMLLCDIGSFEASEELRSLEPFSWRTLKSVSFERNL